MPSNPTSTLDAHGLWSSQPSATHLAPFHSIWNEKDEAYLNAHNGTYAADKYLRGSVLGQGAWSVVHKVKRVVDGKLFAGKVSCDEQMYHEIEILLKFSHHHILKFVELHQQGDAPGAKILITELCAEGDLSEHIHHVPGGMGKVDIFLVISQIADALAFIHGKNYYHADVKPRNILIRTLNPINVALADCADCEVHGNEIYGNDKDIRLQTGTYKYWSPEMAAVNSPHNGKEDDIWALGISLLNMMAQTPQMELTYKNKKHIRRDVRKHTERCAEHAQALQRLNPENGLVKLVNKMVVRASAGRITAVDCHRQAMKLLEQVDKDGEECKDKGTEGLQIQSPDDFKPISFW